MRRLVRLLWLVTRNSAASNDRRCVNYRRACERLADRHGGLRRLAQICVCGSVRFRPEQICAVTDSVSEQQRSVRSISKNWPINVHSILILATKLHRREHCSIRRKRCVTVKELRDTQIADVTLAILSRDKVAQQNRLIKLQVWHQS